MINVTCWVHILPENSFYEDFFCHVNMWQDALLMYFHAFVKGRFHNEETVPLFSLWHVFLWFGVCVHVYVWVCATELDKFHWELIGRKILTCGYICLTVPHTLVQ